MIAVANRLPWICSADPSEFESRGEELSIKSLIELLKTEIKGSEWQLIYMHIEIDAGDNMGFEELIGKMLLSSWHHTHTCNFRFLRIRL